jgi:hypothetical protein
MGTNTSIGPDAEGAGNEDHGNADGGGNKTLGEHAQQQAPAGADVPEQGAERDPAGGRRPADH